MVSACLEIGGVEPSRRLQPDVFYQSTAALKIKNDSNPTYDNIAV
jgi:hypothetical protein